MENALGAELTPDFVGSFMTPSVPRVIPTCLGKSPENEEIHPQMRENAITVIQIHY